MCVGQQPATQHASEEYTKNAAKQMLCRLALEMGNYCNFHFIFRQARETDQGLEN